MKKLLIDVLCNDGSPLGVTLADVYGNNGRLGVGGAELALLTMCEAWHNAGHHVRLYNSPTHMGLSPFEQYPVDTFLPKDERDILIVFRSPNHRILHANGKKIWWSTDQFTVGDFRQFESKVDQIVTISPFHDNFFKETYGIENTTIIDLPVRMEDYDHEIEKVEHRMIFCSVPDRGLDILARAYPGIKRQVPDASLVITSDYRLWGVQDARNERFIQRFLGMDGVRFLGAVQRMEMVEEQLKAEVMAYPCTYDELFCYAVAECQVAGAYPVTTSKGALITTNMAYQVPGEAENPHWLSSFIDAVVSTITSKSLKVTSEFNQAEARERFSLERIMKEWDKVMENE